MAENHLRSMRIIMRLSNALIKNRNKKLAEWDLTSIQSDVLLYILRNIGDGDVSQLDVQNFFKLTNPTVSGIVDRLEEKGFIRRMCSSKDARFRNLIPLQKAYDVRKILMDHRMLEEEHLIEGMSAEEAEEFRRLLLIALGNIEE